MFSRRLTYRSPFDWRRTLAFLDARRIEGIESVGEGRYCRSARWNAGASSHIGWLRVRAVPDQDALELEGSDSLAPVGDPIAAHVRAIFDLDRETTQALRALPAGTPMHGPMRLVGTFDGFELAVRAVVGQQISVKAARTVIARFVSAHGAALADAPAGIERVFPAPATVAALDVAQVASFGINARRAQTILVLARAMAEGSLSLAPGAPVEATVARLLAIPGIGDWTAQYIAMRALCWTDAFPAGDLAVLRALGARTPARAREIARQWQPWRAYAVMNLWSSLGAAG